jgi:hypothetical protein
MVLRLYYKDRKTKDALEKLIEASVRLKQPKKIYKPMKLTATQMSSITNYQSIMVTAFTLKHLS